MLAVITQPYTVGGRAWVSNYMHSKAWDVITYPFLNLNGATVEV